MKDVSIHFLSFALFLSIFILGVVWMVAVFDFDVFYGLYWDVEHLFQRLNIM